MSHLAMVKRLRLLSTLIEAADEEETFVALVQCQRREVKDVYLNRESEGFQHILINRRFMEDDEMFRNIFRVNILQFPQNSLFCRPNVQSFVCSIIWKRS